MDEVMSFLKNVFDTKLTRDHIKKGREFPRSRRLGNEGIKNENCGLEPAEN